MKLADKTNFIKNRRRDNMWYIVIVIFMIISLPFVLASDYGKKGRK